VISGGASILAVALDDGYKTAGGAIGGSKTAALPCSTCATPNPPRKPSTRAPPTRGAHNIPMHPIRHAYAPRRPPLGRARSRPSASPWPAVIVGARQSLSPGPSALMRVPSGREWLSPSLRERGTPPLHPLDDRCVPPSASRCRPGTQRGVFAVRRGRVTQRWKVDPLQVARPREDRIRTRP